MNITTFGRKAGTLGRGFAVVCLLVLGTTVALYGQLLQSAVSPDATSSTMTPANSDGVMVGGNLWESFQPANTVGPQYWEGAKEMTERAVRMGNPDRQWSQPTFMWPGGWTNSNIWGKGLYITVYDPDPAFNPATIGGATNPSYYATSGSNYALAAYANKPSKTPPRVVLGAGDPARDYKRETKWVDAQKRHHTLYEAGWPTTVGVDVKIEVHQYSLHWNAFDAFILMKVTLTNTGMVDMNCDGVAERTNNVIKCLAMQVDCELGFSARLSASASRGSAWGISRRVAGYIGDNDPKGSPWATTVIYPGESGPNVKDMGINDNPFRFYTDVQNGWTWLGAKDATGNPKKTIYGTDAVGIGAERGWYTSAGVARGLGGGYGDPKGTHIQSMGVWFKDGGKTRSTSTLDLSPNPNFFASGTTGDPTTFVPKASPTRPNGDRKLLSLEDPAAFEEITHEPNWTVGYTQHNNFDGNTYHGVGPFGLAVGESMTVTFAEMGGFRLQGVLNALAAARYVYENGDAFLDNYPAVPEIRIDLKAPGIPVLRWDNRAESGPNFGGYKIYRASQAIPIDWTKTGMRVIDDYWKNMTPGATPENLKVPMNPDFTAFDYIAGKRGAADSWGPYDLVKVIPAAQAGSYADNTTTGYNYSWLDNEAPFGFKFWYYVAAYTSTGMTLNSSYAGYKPATTDFVETAKINENGASGLWVNTYPFAYLNADYPRTAEGLKNLGAAVAVDRTPMTLADVQSGAVKITCKPNPYKKKALFDDALNASDHKVVFYNLPPQAKITILDVAGQIIQVLDFKSTGPSNGTIYWNLFSKNGVEVASGLYIWVAEYDGGQQVGYLTIMR